MLLLNGSQQQSADGFLAELESAQDGNGERLGDLLQGCRQYLLLIANQELDRTLAAKAAASDLVQETFLTARRELVGFRGVTRAELKGWLRRILLNHLLNVRRRFIEAQKRGAHREISLDDYFDSAALAVRAGVSSPSSHLMRVEQVQAVAEAVARLPERYRIAIWLRHHEQLPFEEVARQLGLTSPATRQLWARAIKRLKQELRVAEFA